MTQSPYAGAAFPDELVVEERTSVLAVLSLIFGLICCVPGLSLLGLIFGISALIFIGASRGRLGGKGMAITGIVLGLIFSGIWIGLIIGGVSSWNIIQRQMLTPMTGMMQSVDQGDFGAARTHLSANASSLITDEHFGAFRTAYQGELGAYKSAPKDIWEFFGGFSKSGQTMQNFQGGQNIFPVPLTFDKGHAVAVYEFDVVKGGTGGQPDFKIKNVIIMTNAGSKHVLWDPSKGPLPPAPSSTPSTPTPLAPPAGDPPKTEAPEPPKK